MISTKKQIATWWVQIHIAGDYDVARQVCRLYCIERGECVTVTPTTYIYTGGEEAGVCVRFLNYPRFPRDPQDIVDRATDLAHRLLISLAQHSYTLETPKKTAWFSRREGAA